MSNPFDKVVYRNRYKEMKLISVNSVGFEGQLEVFSSLVKRAGITDFFYDETILFDLWRGVNDEYIRLNTVKQFFDRFNKHFTGITIEKYNEYPSLCNLLLLEDTNKPCINNNVLAETIAQNNIVTYKRILQTQNTLEKRLENDLLDAGSDGVFYSKILAICAIACRQRKGEKQILPQLYFIKNLHAILRDIKHIEQNHAPLTLLSNVAEQDRG